MTHRSSINRNDFEVTYFGRRSLRYISTAPMQSFSSPVHCERVVTAAGAAVDEEDDAATAAGIAPTWEPEGIPPTNEPLGISGAMPPEIAP